MKIKPIKPKTVYVAMSGGVDSSVSAGLLKQQGYNVVGVFFKPWSPSAKISYCDWKQDRQDALSVATKLNIPFETWDFSREYGKEVVKYLIDSYKKGLTPNPDVLCNKKIKFGLFLDRALKKGADFIATGHYAQISPDYQLCKGKDKYKDQSYFLWNLSQKQLSKTIFPVGNLQKSEVRLLAEKMNLDNAKKKDSQGVCFVGDLDMKTFLKKYIKPKSGDIILNRNNKVIGKHDGIFYYTIGQRHGLDIKIGNGPFYVLQKDVKKNVIIVTDDEKDLLKKELHIKNVLWTNGKTKLPLKCKVKIRYLGEELPCEVIAEGKKALVKLKKPASSVASGQFAVFYDKNIVLGGGVIE